MHIQHNSGQQEMYSKITVCITTTKQWHSCTIHTTKMGAAAYIILLMTITTLSHKTSINCYIYSLLLTNTYKVVQKKVQNITL